MSGRGQGGPRRRQRRGHDGRHAQEGPQQPQGDVRGGEAGKIVFSTSLTTTGSNQFNAFVADVAIGELVTFEVFASLGLPSTLES